MPGALILSRWAKLVSCPRSSCENLKLMQHDAAVLCSSPMFVRACAHLRSKAGATYWWPLKKRRGRAHNAHTCIQRVPNVQKDENPKKRSFEGISSKSAHLYEKRSKARIPYQSSSLSEISVSMEGSGQMISFDEKATGVKTT